MPGSGWRPPCAARSESVATSQAPRRPNAAPSFAKRSQQQPGSPTSAASTTSLSRLTQETSSSRDDGPALLQLHEEDQAKKQNATVTVRFRPLSPREIWQGEEVAWYADGDTVVRSDKDPNISYTYDRVFAPPTTTLEVYDVAAQHVVSGAMEGINGTIIAYGTTNSGKTHTMHGYQRSPGIIPLAVKDAFSIIQEMPNCEFLLRVSYLEIYNEVINDLLNPAGQNLQIRNHPLGTFVEGIKEEVVLSPAHALSLIAAGEEHRHDGSTNSNLLSSESHVIFTLTIESSSYGKSNEAKEVTFSQLHLIDLAGPVSAMARTPGVRRKGGSYFNESLLTLGTVISKLSDGEDTDIPFRDSKLTLLLQSSLSGQGRVSLICTVTPASSISQDTHNTLKISQCVKCIEIQASANKIIDEKSLIKKYQDEIHRLKEELDPRLEQEEEAKSLLLARIQRLTKLILVSTKATHTSRFSPYPGPSRHSFTEEEIAYLPHSRRDIMLDNDTNELLVRGEKFGATLENSSKEEKKNKKGLLNWFTIQKHGGASTRTSSDCGKSTLTKSTAPSSPIGESLNFHAEPIISNSLVNDSLSADMLSIGHGEFPSSDHPGEETLLVKVADKRVIQYQLQEKKSSGVSHEAHHSDQKITVPTEISAEALQNKQQVYSLIDQLSRLFRDLKQQTVSLEKQISQVMVDKLDRSPIKETDNRIIQDQTSECMEKRLSQDLQAKDSQKNIIVMQKTSGVNHEAQQEKTVLREISVEPLQNKQQVACLINRLLRLMGDMKQQLASLENHAPHSLSDSEVKV